MITFKDIENMEYFLILLSKGTTYQAEFGPIYLPRQIMDDQTYGTGLAQEQVSSMRSDADRILILATSLMRFLRKADA